MSMLVAEMIKAYSSEPIAQYEMDEYDCKYTQGNSVCGDSITVFLKLSNDKKTIEEYSHTGTPHIFTLAAASMLAEVIEGKKIGTVMERGGEYMRGLGLEVSPRRKRSTVSALLAVHNGLVEYLGAGEKRDYNKILEK